MRRFSPLVRVSLGLVTVTCSILITLDLMGLLPSQKDGLFDARILLCERLAVHAAPLIERNDFTSVRAALQLAVNQNEDVLSAGLRSSHGRLVVAIEDHRELWNSDRDQRSAAMYVEVPLFKRSKRWGTIEIRFRDAGAGGGVLSLARDPLLRMIALVAIVGFFSYLLYMRRTLRHLDPSAVIPSRVQGALDVMTEGVMLVDHTGSIVLANAVLAERLEREPAALLGNLASRLPWKIPTGPGESRMLPWLETIDSGDKSTGMRLLLKTPSGVTRSFMVNAAPVLDGRGKPIGAIVTFDDVSDLERKTMELEQALVMLEKSQEEIRLHNEELQLLARRDPLTDVANRRAFMEIHEILFEGAMRGGRPLSCIMVDIDHFKLVNDNHGHQMGDRVIIGVAEALKSAVRGSDAVCRYGGEEFCIALTDAPIDGAAVVAERIREKIEAPGFADVPVTASLGVTSIAFGAKTLLELINQADEALYASKEGGRNRVTRWDQRDAAAGPA